MKATPIKPMPPKKPAKPVKLPAKVGKKLGRGPAGLSKAMGKSLAAKGLSRQAGRGR